MDTSNDELIIVKITREDCPDVAKFFRELDGDSARKRFGDLDTRDEFAEKVENNFFGSPPLFNGGFVAYDADGKTNDVIGVIDYHDQHDSYPSGKVAGINIAVRKDYQGGGSSGIAKKLAITQIKELQRQGYVYQTGMVLGITPSEKERILSRDWQEFQKSKERDDGNIEIWNAIDPRYSHIEPDVLYAQHMQSQKQASLSEGSGQSPVGISDIDFSSIREQGLSVPFPGEELLWQSNNGRMDADQLYHSIAAELPTNDPGASQNQPGPRRTPPQSPAR